MQFAICKEPAHALNCSRETRTALLSSKSCSTLTTISGLGKAQGRRIWGEFSRSPLCQGRVGLATSLGVSSSYYLTVNATKAILPASSF